MQNKKGSFLILKNIKIALFVFMIFGLICTFSCKSESGEDTGKKETATEKTATEAVTEGRIPDGLPVRDYENYEFVILAVDPENVSEIPQLTAEEETGDIINDNTYRRNIAVEERFNIKITPKYVTWLEVPDYLRNAVGAGDDTYDLALLMVHQVGGVVVSNLLRSWNELEHIVDFDKPWWQKEANKAFNYGDKIYLTTGDMCTSIFYYSSAVYFNKKLAVDYGTENLYEAVRDKKWTLDRLAAVTKNIYKDLDGTMPYDNMYGFAATCSNEIDAFLPAADLFIVEQKDGELVFGFNNERMMKLVDSLVDFFHQPSTYCNKDIWTVSRDRLFDMFSSDRLLVTPGMFMTLINNTRNMESDYGILPYPMLDETQGGYFNTPSDLLATLVIPSSLQNANMERVGVITEALNREAHYTVRPAFYDVVLKVKTSRDEDSEEMIDIVLAGRRYDLGQAFANQFSGIAYMLRNLVNDNKTDFVSRFEKLENQGKAALKTIQDNFLNLD